MVTRYISVSRRVPLIPMGSRMPVSLSTVYSCGMACSSSRSVGMACARATSLARSTSDLLISSLLTATIPFDVIARTCSPAMPVYTSVIVAPAIRSASCSALRMERVVSSMSETTPRRMPVVRACPTPSTLTNGKRRRKRNAIQPSGKHCPSPKPYSREADGKNVTIIAPDKWTPGMKAVADYAVMLGHELMDVAVTVTFVNTTNAFLVCYAPGDLHFNMFRLGHAWFGERDQ